ncbi:hypothetical protein SAMN04488498_104362 [Mesorhizobium albiziae]|uniref:Uncharacterized protein n=1 Tax=Neomesorhizobium albiziae TaxID=335020 RepID=A0A1I3YDB4_9HYPH|nr:hypothetical protein [Mesorhizobium albiziae]GLS29932.1 hypothetical protein GCM10007937_16400 [Mesorhizobium albiziae]SFK29805.1 hypothetical protein SAMN04488498_104362 [Mesorhizobium albiziae]
MVGGCFTIVILALGSIAVILRRAYAAPGALCVRDFLLLAIAAGAALGAWAVGLVALALQVAA